MIHADADLDEVDALLASRLAQGLPEHLEDEAASARVAAILDRAQK